MAVDPFRQVGREAASAEAEAKSEHRTALGGLKTSVAEAEKQVREEASKAKAETAEAYAPAFEKLAGMVVLEKKRRALPGYTFARIKEVRATKESLETEREKALGDIDVWKGEQLTSIGEQEKELEAGLSTQLAYALSKIGRWKHEATSEVRKAEREAEREYKRGLAEWKEDKVELDTGEWVSEVEFKALSPEAQAKLKALGVEGYNRWVEAETAKAKAVETKLAPYKVDGGYNLQDALKAGVSESFLLEAGFTQENIEDAKHPVTITATGIVLAGMPPGGYERYYEVPTKEGIKYVEASEWEGMPLGEQFKTSYGRFPTEEEYISFGMSGMELEAPGKFWVPLQAAFQWFKPGEQEKEKLVRVAQEFREDYWAEFPGMKWSLGATEAYFATPLFPSAKWRHPFVPIEEVTKAEILASGINIALLVAPFWVPPVFKGIRAPVRAIKYRMPTIGPPLGTGKPLTTFRIPPTAARISAPTLRMPFTVTWKPLTVFGKPVTAARVPVVTFRKPITITKQPIATTFRYYGLPRIQPSLRTVERRLAATSEEWARLQMGKAVPKPTWKEIATRYGIIDVPAFEELPFRPTLTRIRPKRPYVAYQIKPEPVIQFRMSWYDIPSARGGAPTVTRGLVMEPFTAGAARSFRSYAAGIEERLALGRMTSAQAARVFGAPFLPLPAIGRPIPKVETIQEIISRTAPIVAPAISPVVSPKVVPVTAPMVAPIVSPIVSPFVSPITTPLVAPITEAMPVPITGVELMVQVKPLTQAETLTAMKTMTRRATTLLARTGRMGGGRKPLPLMPGGKPRLEEAEEWPQGTFAWRQGMGWRGIPPPYEDVKPLWSEEPPAGITKFATGPGSAYRTAQIIGGGTVPSMDIDLGVVDVFTREDEILFRGGGLKTNVGKRHPSPTRGMSVKKTAGFKRVRV